MCNDFNDFIVVLVDSVCSTMLQWLSTILPLLCTVLQLVAGSDKSDDIERSLWQPSYVVSLVSVCSTVCVVIVIMACTKWCPRETSESKVTYVVITVHLNYPCFITYERLVIPL